MYRRAVALALSAAMSVASPAGAQKRDTLSTFDRLDLQAQLFMDYLRCSASAFNAIQAKVMAPPDSGTHILCAMVKDRMIAAFVKSESARWGKVIREANLAGTQ